MPTLSDFRSELKARNVRKTLGIYVTTALTTIGILKLFTETYRLQVPALFPIVVTILSCGLVSAFLFAWFHGKEGAQKFSQREIASHVLVGIIALILSLQLISQPVRHALPPDAKTVAVLPFENLSGNKEDEYFSDGITEDILTQLSKVGELSVIARTAVMKYKQLEMEIPSIARELGVGAILKGSVRRIGDRVRIDGKLLDAKNEGILWAETYDRDMNDIFAIQSEVAQKIASELKAHLSPDEVSRVNAKPTANLEAYMLYLRAREVRNLRTMKDNEEAIVLLRNALALDSHYALAYAELGMAYISRYLVHGFGVTMADSGIAFGKKAIELDSSRAEGYHTVGKGYEGLGKPSLALRYYNKAIALSPSYAPTVASFGWVAFAVGRLDEALAWMKKSIELDPLATMRYVGIGAMHNYLGEDSLALMWLNKALALRRESHDAYWYLTYLHLYNGNIREARKALESAMKIDSTDNNLLHAAGDVELISGNVVAARDYYQKSVNGSSLINGPGNQLAFALLKLGKKKEAAAILDSNLVVYEHLSADNPEDFNNPVAVAMVKSMQGNRDEALLWLRRAVERGSRDYRWFKVDPLLEGVRTHPGFQRLMDDIRLRVEEMRQHAKAKGLFNR